MVIYYPNLTEILNERIRDMQFDMEDEGISYEPFTSNITQTTEMVIVNANNRMIRFKQNFINEGHIVDAIYKIDDPLTKAILDGLDFSRILEIVSYPRDMIVSLKTFEGKKDYWSNGYIFFK